MKRIPVYQPELSGNEKKYVNECLDTNWISSQGHFVRDFENEFARYIDARHALAVSNGTVAVHLALLALGIGPGDEVIVPTFTYIASVNAIRYTGATPVFVDSLPDTWQMDPGDVKTKLTDRTRAIMAVHLYGHPCDMRSLCDISRDRGIFVIEDAAEAFGSKIGEGYVGTFGDITAFSFYGNKTITCGEGGMVVTNDETLHARAARLRGQGLAQYRQYWHDIVGYNYRMTNICAAIGLAQLEQADDFIARKRQIAHWYEELLAGSPVATHRETQGYTHTFWMCTALVPHADQRDALRRALDEAGVETRPTFYPVHTMPMYSDKYQRHAVAEDLGWRGMNLPSWPGLSRDDIEHICGVIKKFFEED